MGERRPDGGRAHRRLAARPRPVLALLRPAVRVAGGQAAQRAPTRRWPSSSAAGCSRRDHAEHRPPAPRGRAPRRWSRCTGRSRRASCLDCGGAYPTRPRCVELLDADGAARPRCDCVAPLKPDVVLFGEMLPEDAMARGARAGRRGRPDALRRLVARGLSGGRAAAASTLDAGGRLALVTKGPTPYDATPRSSSTATSWTSWRRCWLALDVAERRSAASGDGSGRTPRSRAPSAARGQRRGVRAPRRRRHASRLVSSPSSAAFAAAPTGSRSARSAGAARPVARPARRSAPRAPRAAWRRPRAAAGVEVGSRAQRSSSPAQRRLAARRASRPAAPAGACIAAPRRPAPAGPGSSRRSASGPRPPARRCRSPRARRAPARA